MPGSWVNSHEACSTVSQLINTRSPSWLDNKFTKLLIAKSCKWTDLSEWRRTQLAAYAGQLTPRNLQETSRFSSNITPNGSANNKTQLRVLTTINRRRRRRRRWMKLADASVSMDISPSSQFQTVGGFFITKNVFFLPIPVANLCSLRYLSVCVSRHSMYPYSKSRKSPLNGVLHM